MKPIIRIPQQGRTVSLVGDVYRFLATGEDTNCKYALIEALVGPGGGPPPHVHSREEEGFYILEGEITFTINGERVVATAGMPWWWSASEGPGGVAFGALLFVLARPADSKGGTA